MLLHALLLVLCCLVLNLDGLLRLSSDRLLSVLDGSLNGLVLGLLGANGLVGVDTSLLGLFCLVLAGQGLHGDQTGLCVLCRILIEGSLVGGVEVLGALNAGNLGLCDRCVLGNFDGALSLSFGTCGGAFCRLLLALCVLSGCLCGCHAQSRRAVPRGIRDAVRQRLRTAPESRGQPEVRPARCR